MDFTDIQKLRNKPAYYIYKEFKTTNYLEYLDYLKLQGFGNELSIDIHEFYLKKFPHLQDLKFTHKVTSLIKSKYENEVEEYYFITSIHRWSTGKTTPKIIIKDKKSEHFLIVYYKIDKVGYKVYEISLNIDTNQVKIDEISFQKFEDNMKLLSELEFKFHVAESHRQYIKFNIRLYEKLDNKLIHIGKLYAKKLIVEEFYKYYQVSPISRHTEDKLNLFKSSLTMHLNRKYDKFINTNTIRKERGTEIIDYFQAKNCIIFLVLICDENGFLAELYINSIDKEKMNFNNIITFKSLFSKINFIKYKYVKSKLEENRMESEERELLNAYVKPDEFERVNFKISEIFVTENKIINEKRERRENQEEKERDLQKVQLRIKKLF